MRWVEGRCTYDVLVFVNVPLRDFEYLSIYSGVSKALHMHGFIFGGARRAIFKTFYLNGKILLLNTNYFYEGAFFFFFTEKYLC